MAITLVPLMTVMMMLVDTSNVISVNSRVAQICCTSHFLLTSMVVVLLIWFLKVHWQWMVLLMSPPHLGVWVYGPPCFLVRKVKMVAGRRHRRRRRTS